MKIMAGAPASGSPGDVRKNEAEAGRLIDRAKAAGADLLILPELCLTGAGCGDLLRYELLTRSAGQAALLDKKSRERWLMAAWLAVSAEQLAYPLRVHSSERPDFLLSAPGLAVGVECMEVVPEELKRLQTQLRDINSGWLRPVLALQPGRLRAASQSLAWAQEQALAWAQEQALAQRVRLVLSRSWCLRCRRLSAH